MAPWSRLNTWVVIFIKRIFFIFYIVFFKHITLIKFTWTLLQARCGAHIGSMTAQKQRGIQLGKLLDDVPLYHAHKQ